MMLQKKPSLSTYMNDLVSHGQIVFTRGDAGKVLNISPGAFYDAVGRQQQLGKLISPRQGFYVIVPEQFRRWGAPPPSWYIHALMKYEERSYYVSLLKAAELHGASHQAVMEFQVMTDKRMPTIKAGRSIISFYYRKNLGAFNNAIDQYPSDAGPMRVSSAELTALDLVRYPHAAGGLDHIATVLSDLSERINARKLVQLAPHFERSVVQRLGYLLEWFGSPQRAYSLRKALQRYKRVPWVELDPARSSDPDFTPAPIERNSTWRVIVRRHPEPDS